jgi:hypothetical protein
LADTKLVSPVVGWLHFQLLAQDLLSVCTAFPLADTKLVSPVVGWLHFQLLAQDLLSV